ncbi:glycoside hydrolase family 3 protein [Pseudoalteromonas denitrificans]|uniref:beta-N-acetylhexosaminidase n=1 Tax=Pseudoalteromonas denitrificans DSM 6059 TaxID=1123010 RepID=A0A1I1LG90_9GAMM|nr:glycoside hydrolase family 3 protein [Pseudoalteromonas denitrificans]SFC71976.1 beta-N-acetylhexosaminidase [Pseudoalteromonas denitrificans DSM 6059]
MQANATDKKTSLKVQIAQKIMIDLRFYNEHPITAENPRKAMTQLPKEIAQLISQTSLGGIILFSDNLESPQQIIKLNHDLQLAATNSSLKSPLLISIDQEGGRVFRTSRSDTIAFTGNMSIGATYQEHGCDYATKTAEVLATELNSLGFNVNHAPTIDVNSNKNNPVINVRSFGENPDVVAKLGQAQVSAMQKHNIISTLKHFPGHGDTDVDSHTGLPIVMHDLETVYKMDIAPFKQIIKHDAPGMVMTAHIQYPNLDNSEFIAKSGVKMLKPATMSRKMITNILREELAYKGVVITDALDMKGIKDFFTEDDAVINTFKAGVDIALMPIKIRTAQDLNKLPQLIDAVANAVNAGELDKHEICESFKRIQKLKYDYELVGNVTTSLTDKISHSKTQLLKPENLIIEQQLAEAAITLVTSQNNILPINNRDIVHLIMPDKTKCLALSSMLQAQFKKTLFVTHTNMQNFDITKAQHFIDNANIVIGAHIAPKQSAAEMGGMDDLITNKQRIENIANPKDVYDLLKFAKVHNKKTVFISLRTPYEIAQFNDVADISLATYAYNTHLDSHTHEIKSPIFSALAKVLSGHIKAKGYLPVTVKI